MSDLKIRNNVLAKLIKFGFLKAELFFEGQRDDLPVESNFYHISKFRGKNKKVVMGTTVPGIIDYYGAINFPGINGQLGEGKVRLRSVEGIIYSDKNNLITSVVCGLDGKRLQPAYTTSANAVFYWYNFVLITAEKISNTHAEVKFQRVLLTPNRVFGRQKGWEIKVIDMGGLKMLLPKLKFDFNTQLTVIKEWLRLTRKNRTQYALAVLTALRKVSGDTAPRFFLSKEVAEARSNQYLKANKIYLECAKALEENIFALFDCFTAGEEESVLQSN